MFVFNIVVMHFLLDKSVDVDQILLLSPTSLVFCTRCGFWVAGASHTHPALLLNALDKAV